MVLVQDDGPVNLIRPFEELGRRTIRDWSLNHIAAALPGQRANYPRKIHDEAWKTVLELSRYARKGILPLYPCKRVEASVCIAPSLIWLIYPLGPASKQSTRGLVELVDGTMIEAVADIIAFRKFLQSDHSPLPQTGPPLKYPDYYYAAMAFLQDYLAEEPKKVADCKAQGQARGLSHSTLSRARDDLKIISYRNGTVWFWKLPDA